MKPERLIARRMEQLRLAMLAEIARQDAEAAKKGTKP